MLLDSFGAAGPVLKDQFDMLMEIGRLFLVRPENLRSILQEGFLAAIDSKLLIPFIEQRNDFISANIQQYFPEYINYF